MEDEGISSCSDGISEEGGGGLLAAAQIRLESSSNLGTCYEPSGRVFRSGRGLRT
jgi:hypothetical protein